jgi:hypothetical protein
LHTVVETIGGVIRVATRDSLLAAHWNSLAAERVAPPEPDLARALLPSWLRRELVFEPWSSAHSTITVPNIPASK